jgi:hypothetical protein
MVYALFVPIFFVGIGLRIDFLASFDLFLAIFVSVIGIGSRYLSAWLGTSFTRDSQESTLPQWRWHTPGGTMEIVFAACPSIWDHNAVGVCSDHFRSRILLRPPQAWLNYSISRAEVSILEFFTGIRSSRVEGHDERQGYRRALGTGGRPAAHIRCRRHL